MSDQPFLTSSQYFSSLTNPENSWFGDRSLFFAILWRCHSLVFVQLLLHIPFLFLDPFLTVLVQANLQLVLVQANLQVRQLRAWSAAGGAGHWIDCQSLKRNNQNTWKERVTANTDNVFFYKYKSTVKTYWDLEIGKWQCLWLQGAYHRVAPHGDTPGWGG